VTSHAVGIAIISACARQPAFNLENVVRDPRYTNEIRVDSRRLSLHPGHDLDDRAKNVYTILVDGLLRILPELKRILKQVDISVPRNAVMFASDAFPFNDAVGAEETTVAVRSARTAVAAALAELVAEGRSTKLKRSS